MVWSCWLRERARARVLDSMTCGDDGGSVRIPEAAQKHADLYLGPLKRVWVRTPRPPQPAQLLVGPMEVLPAVLDLDQRGFSGSEPESCSSRKQPRSHQLSRSLEVPHQVPAPLEGGGGPAVGPLPQPGRQASQTDGVGRRRPAEALDGVGLQLCREQNIQLQPRTQQNPQPASPSSSSVPGRYCSTRLSEVLSAVSTPLRTSRTTRLSRTTARVLSMPPCTATRVRSTALLSVSETVSLALETI